MLSGARTRVRTGTVRILSPLTLPVGLCGPVVSLLLFRTSPLPLPTTLTGWLEGGAGWCRFTEYGAPGRDRTCNIRPLRPATLPIGPQGRTSLSWRRGRELNPQGVLRRSHGFRNRFRRHIGLPPHYVGGEEGIRTLTTGIAGHPHQQCGSATLQSFGLLLRTCAWDRRTGSSAQISLEAGGST